MVSNPEQLIMDAAARAVKFAPDGDPDGYAASYMLMMNRPLPRHGYRWIEKMYKAHSEGLGLLTEAARGFTKTTVLTNNFTTYRIGLEPLCRNVIFRSSDDKAVESTERIASLIENNSGWKLIFPNVVPDPGSMWSSKGYNVKRIDIPYSDWTRKIISQDPCFTGFGYASATSLGSHPDGVLAMDDIDTETNTYSDKERAQTRKFITDTAFPMIVPKKTWYFYNGTPWRDDDTIAYLKSTGAFVHDFCPAQEDGKETGAPTWPEMFDEKELELCRKRMGSLGYARMMLLDIKAAMGQVLQVKWLHTYPYDKIDPLWPKVFGVDYASTQYETGEKEQDHFALCVECLIPGGGAIVIDGFVGNLSQGEAEYKLMQWFEMYSPTRIGVEDLGAGREFYSHLIRNPRLPVVPSKVGNKSKGVRFEKELAPLFEFNKIMLSSQDNEFLKAFRDEWISYPNGKHDDTLDAVWHATKQAIPNLENITDVEGFTPAPKKKQKHPAVWFAQAE
jgi:hypothetical protein